MSQIKQTDLKYTDYSWTAVPGDDPKKTVEDADRFSRQEGYEVLDLLNSLKGQNGADLDIKVRQICEWMIREHLPSHIQSRQAVSDWIANNYKVLWSSYPG